MTTDHVKDSVRDEFSKLNLDGKTSFLVEAIFSTAGSAINEIGVRLNGLVGLVTDPFGDSDNGSEAETGASEETAPEETAADEETAAEDAGPADGAAAKRASRTRKAGSKKT